MPNATVSLPRQVGRTLSEYVRGQARIVAILSGLYAVGYALAGLPLWLLLGLLCGALNVVPVFGSLIALGLSMYWTLLAEGDLWQYGAVLAVYVAVQAVEGFWLTPKILGKTLRLPALTVFVVVLGASVMLGPIGVLLAVPALAVALVVWRYFSGSGSATRR